MTAPDARSLLAALVEALPQWSPHPDIKDRVSGPLVSIPDVRGAIARALAAPATPAEWECGATEGDGKQCSRPAGHKGMHRKRLFSALGYITAAAPATLAAIDTRIVWKRDHGMVIVTGDEEPQSLEIPAWAVRTIFDVAGKDPAEEARKVSAFINAHTGLDVERLAPSVYAQGHGLPDHCAEHGDIPGTQSMVWHVREAHGLTQEQWYTLEEADRIRGVQPFDPHAVHDHAAPDAEIEQARAALAAPATLPELSQDLTGGNRILRAAPVSGLREALLNRRAIHGPNCRATTPIDDLCTCDLTPALAAPAPPAGLDVRSDRFRAAVKHVFEAPGDWGPAQGYYDGNLNHFIDMLDAAYAEQGDAGTEK